MIWTDIPLKDRASKLKSMSEGKSVAKKLRLMKDMYKGENVYIVSCGPSLAGLPSELLTDKLSQFPVMTIKQAFGVVEDIVDFHHFNCNNFTRYDTSSKFVIAGASSPESSIRSRLWGDADLDIFFPINGGGGNPTVCSNGDFEGNTYDRASKVRMWGPGTLFETTLFTALHTGASKISLIGVDLGPSEFEDSGTSLGHFYDSKESDKVDGPVGVLFKGENELTKQGFSKFNTFLKSKGVDLEICSDGSYLPEEINRNLWLY